CQTFKSYLSVPF
nr:immunoglobulin light chain junction region [Macaca mulatta]MOV78934.1 immunoglobulin light chain junction region [Macaca mulatta]MOV79196.1 immunoglobulin light chain junction region [Macaca mulatta]MOV80080.1 immunoglobulin light chain junction region [Macaca mulatta]MOV82332.1 immunoglobulin light chain junction region [Macaca mulatta]